MAVVIVALLNVVGMCIALWFWGSLIDYASELKRLSAHLYPEAETMKRTVDITIWVIAVALYLNLLLVMGLCMLRNWARRILIVLYVLSAVGSLFNFNVLGIVWALVPIVLLTRPSVVEAFTGQMSRVDY
jgi:hypothetical protein